MRPITLTGIWNIFICSFVSLMLNVNSLSAFSVLGWNITYCCEHKDNLKLICMQNTIWCSLVLSKTGQRQKELYLLKSWKCHWRRVNFLYIDIHFIYLDRKNISLPEDGLQMLKVVNPRAELRGGGLLSCLWMLTNRVANTGKVPLGLLLLRFKIKYILLAGTHTTCTQPWTKEHTGMN